MKGILHIPKLLLNFRSRDAYIMAENLHQLFGNFENHPIVCLCGSTRFKDEFMAVSRNKTLKGEIVLSVVFYGHSDPGGEPTNSQKQELGILHRKKILLADYVYIINVGGYIGDNTRSEIRFARANEKPVVFHEESEE